MSWSSVCVPARAPRVHRLGRVDGSAMSVLRCGRENYKWRCVCGKGAPGPDGHFDCHNALTEGASTAHESDARSSTIRPGDIGEQP